LPEAQISDHLQGVRSVIAKCVEIMPGHAQYIAAHCAAT